MRVCERKWGIAEASATPEHFYLDRRSLLRSLPLGGILTGSMNSFIRGAIADEDIGSPSIYHPTPRNARYAITREITDEGVASKYNNFFEFGSHKSIWKLARKMPVQPWTVHIDGMVQKEIVLDFDRLLLKMSLEERLYRHRCVEAWSMIVPWSGFPLVDLVRLCEPLASAKYIRMETFRDAEFAPGHRQSWYPWPYVEGLTIEEATNELAFIATGIYGKQMPGQHGAPLRLVVPWKYGVKSIKSIVRISFTDRRPTSFWEQVQGSEYGFWANVNPDVPHPRWSQETERLLGSGERIPTRIFNGYGEYVAHLYKRMDGERLFV